MIKNLTLSIFICSILSCSKSDEQIEETPSFSGYYEIILFESNKAVDLNNDGNLSTDLTNETGFYFSNTVYDLEIRPMINQTNYSKLISFSFPETYLTFHNSDNSNYSLEFAESNFGTAYKEVNDTEIRLIQSNFDQLGKIENFHHNGSSNTHIELTFSKSYYNFKTNDWEKLTINVAYRKISL